MKTETKCFKVSDRKICLHCNSNQIITNGNMLSDLNKDITEILYNHLNLPTHIYFGNNGSIEYIYNAAGQKVKKTVHDTPNNTIKHVDYLDGFQIEERDSRIPVGAIATRNSNNEQYAGDILQFFPHAEGYVSVTQGNRLDVNGNISYVFNYVYNHTDHLGNIRLSYTKDPVSGDLKIMEENHYYPFGLKHTAYSSAPKQKYELVDNMPGGGEEIARPTYVLKTDYQYKYNGKEFQDELNLNLYDYGWRNYDPALGRWISPDPLSEEYPSWSPYNYTKNNPVYFIDPNGLWVDDYIFNENGDYVRTDKNNKPDQIVIENSKTGKKEGTYSFNDPNDAKAIDNGDITQVIFINESDINIEMQFGLVDSENENPMNYLERESRPAGNESILSGTSEGKLDFKNSAFNMTPGALHLVKKGSSITGEAYNDYDYGNFLWGVAGYKLGFSHTTLKAGSHANNAVNGRSDNPGMETGILDSPEDQRAIKNGYNYFFRPKQESSLGGAIRFGED